MKTTLATFALVALCIVAIFNWPSISATAPMGFGVSLTGVGMIVPGSTICPLLGRA